MWAKGRAEVYWMTPRGQRNIGIRIFWKSVSEGFFDTVGSRVGWGEGGGVLDDSKGSKEHRYLNFLEKCF